VQPDPLEPSASVLCKLGSIIVHAEEMLTPSKRHVFDYVAFNALLDDPEVVEWLKGMGAQGLLPVKR
jgi:hypothetical protein